jgi:hypothetical protein
LVCGTQKEEEEEEGGSVQQYNNQRSRLLLDGEKQNIAMVPQETKKTEEQQ